MILHELKQAILGWIDQLSHENSYLEPLFRVFLSDLSSIPGQSKNHKCPSLSEHEVNWC